MQFRRMLPDLGSNQDLQIQNLTYYHYTIGQIISIQKRNYYFRGAVWKKTGNEGIGGFAVK